MLYEVITLSARIDDQLTTDEPGRQLASSSQSGCQRSVAWSIFSPAGGSEEPGEYHQPDDLIFLRRAKRRITSYNVCYTKLLRTRWKLAAVQQTILLYANVDECAKVHHVANGAF